VDSLYLLIPVALVFVAVGIKLLLWAIDNGQYDDLDKEAWRILAEDNKANVGSDSSDQSRSVKTDPTGQVNEKDSA
jgi:cbb3-type cytochrome oxidase maturation protein